MIIRVETPKIAKLFESWYRDGKQAVHTTVAGKGKVGRILR